MGRVWATGSRAGASCRTRRLVVLGGELLNDKEDLSSIARQLPVEGSDVKGLLKEMIDLLVTNSGFRQVKMDGKAETNRTTELAVRFLLWLEGTPEAQAALRLALRRLRGDLHFGSAFTGRG